MSRNVNVKEVPRGGKNGPLFRQVARDSSGESFDTEEGNRVFFAYLRNQHDRRSETLIGAASYRPANPRTNNPGEEFLSDFYHTLTYLFVKSAHKGEGVGTCILKQVEKSMLSRCKRNIRIQSAGKSVRFFEKHGYVIQGEPVQCVCSGSPLFSVLYNMEKVVT